MLKNIFAYASNFGLFLTITKKHIVLRRLLPKSLFFKLIFYRHKVIEKKIRSVVQDYESRNLQINIENNETKKIWFCWLQGKESMPDIVKSCYNSVVKNRVTYQVRFISLYNYKEFVSLPQYILKMYEKGIIKNAHFADIIRTYLLYKYGGLWIDATIYVNRQIPDYYNYDFYSLKLNSNPIYVSDCRWCNFFLFGKPGNKVMELTLKLFYSYLMEKNLFIDYFMMDYFIDIAYRDNLAVRESIDKIEPFGYDIYEMDKNLDNPLSLIPSFPFSIPFNKLHWKGDFQVEKNGEETLYHKIIEK